MIDTLSQHAQRIAELEASGTLTGTHAHLLGLQHNDIADDIDALKAKIRKFGEAIDRVEHDSQRALLAAEAQERFAKIVSDIRDAADASALENGRRIIQTLAVWE